ncbi:MAG: ABC transporter permease subunit [Pseudonocardiales bacterium]
MIWLIWRQHRAQALVGAILLAGLSTTLVVVGSMARHTAQQYGLPDCTATGGDCGDALAKLHKHFHWLPPVTATLVALPLLAGMFWAAPLLSREYEAGTHRLAWTQSISPLRWITTKIVLICSVATLAALALGLLSAWALAPLTPAFGTRYNSTWFDIQGVVPAACMLFALAGGIAASAVVRRTIPAIAIALVLFAAARFPVHLIRSHLAPTAVRTVTYPLAELLGDIDGDHPLVAGSAPNVNDWILSTARLDPDGRSVGGLNNRGVLINYCPSLPPRDAVSRAAKQACLPRLQGLSGREVTTYQPAGHFWRIQAVEALAFAGLGALLAAVAVLGVTRRRAA